MAGNKREEAVSEADFDLPLIKLHPNDTEGMRLCDGFLDRLTSRTKSQRCAFAALLDLF